MATSRLLTPEEEMKPKLLSILRQLKKKREDFIKNYERSRRAYPEQGVDKGKTEATIIAEKIDALVEAGILLGILSKYVSPKRWY